MSNNIEIQLRSEIMQQLRAVTIVNSPNIYEMIQTDRGYQAIEAKVIEKVIDTGITVAAAVPQVELEYEML